MPSKYGYEVRSAGVVSNLIVNSAEFSGEWVGNLLQSGLVGQPSEYGFEVQAVGIAINLPVVNAEFQGEWLSNSAIQGYPPDSAEFGFEVRSAGLTPFYITNPQASEYGHEMANALIAMGAVAVHSYEHHYEIMGNVGSYLEIRSAEFDYELRPVFLSHIAPDTAEFEYEALGGQELGGTHEIAPGSAEFGFDALSLQLAASDFDVAYEANSVAIEQFSNATTITPYEYGHELSSPQVIQQHFVNNGFETGVIIDSEFNFEAQSGSFPGVPEIEDAEFGWEVPSPMFRYFLRRPKTPTHRKVQVRV